MNSYINLLKQTEHEQTKLRYYEKFRSYWVEGVAFRGAAEAQLKGPYQKNRMTA